MIYDLNVGKLKELLKDAPDDAYIYIETMANDNSLPCGEMVRIVAADINHAKGFEKTVALFPDETVYHKSISEFFYFHRKKSEE